MTRKELNLAIFERTTDKVLWQPRLEEWIHKHVINNNMPERFAGMSHFDIYDELRCSCRYGAHSGLDFWAEPDGVEVVSERRGNKVIETTKTPVGDITTVHHQIWEGDRVTNSRIEDFPCKTPADLKVATYLVDRMQCKSNVEAFKAAAERLGDRGEPTIFTTSSGFTELVKNWAGLLDTFYLLTDYPAAVEAFLEACDRRDDRVIDAALELPCRIYNLGDHATDEFTPPPICKKYMMPRWQRLSERLHAKGRFVHSHWDGHSHTILPFLMDSGLDSVEALTPVPMGNITLEEIKTAVGDKLVVLDLLPAIHFLPSYTTEELLEFTRKVIDMFAPRLILGVSDEISYNGQIEKIEAVTELVDSICGLPEQ